MEQLSLPREHGGYMLLAGVAVTGVWLGPARGAALGAVLVVAMAFLGRGPIERRASRQLPRAWDLPAMVAITVLAVLGVSVAAASRPAAAPWLVVGASALVIGTFLARRGRFLRVARFEMAAMGGLGASAGLTAWCGGLAPSYAIAIAAVLGAHAATSVTLVRARVRKGRIHGRQLLSAAAILFAGVAVVVGTGHVEALFGLAPRAFDLGTSAIRGVKHAHARAVGWRETALLAAAVAILVESMT